MYTGEAQPRPGKAHKICLEWLARKKKQAISLVPKYDFF